MVSFLRLRKVKRNTKYLLLGAVFVTAAVAVYLEYAATIALYSQDLLPKPHAYMNLAEWREKGEGSSDISWRSEYVPQPWKPEYKGQVNLHVFEDWCGTSVTSLRKNLHYPLYPHSRLMVKKLAVAPGWMNYGLRVFGYIHPYTHGEFLFAVASNDNCEFWLSLDESPDNLHLCAYVGKTGNEWTAPGEYMKYRSQISKPILLEEQKRYYFELIHKHSDKETDHVEVAWRLNEFGKTFVLIESDSLSLYTNESSLKLSDVSHIPQTVASHAARPINTTQIPQHDVGMLREDPRDTFFQRPLLDQSFLQNVLPICYYKPSYALKGFKVSRYQGLRFVRLSYVYPNDFTRLTHMERENKCFYKKQYYIQGFPKYMRLDNPNGKPPDYRDKDRIRRRNRYAFRDMEREDTEKRWMDVRNDHDEARQGYWDDYDEDTVDRRRKLLSGKDVTINPRGHENAEIKENEGERRLRTQSKMEDVNHFLHNPPADGKKQVTAWAEGEVERIPNLGNNLRLNQHTPDRVQTGVNQRAQNLVTVRALNNQMAVGVENEGKLSILSLTNPHNITPHEEKDMAIKLTKFNGSPTKATGTKLAPPIKERKRGLRDRGVRGKTWGVLPLNTRQGGSDLRKSFIPKVVYDPVINWTQTFLVSHMDFQALRSDRIDLECNVSGNLLMDQLEAVAVVHQFMEQLNQNFPSQFSLQKIVNVEKQVSVLRGSHYLLELDLLDASDQPVRLVHHVYVLKSHMREQQAAQTQSVNTHLQLCTPRAFRWNPKATVHFIVPVKNQARWVQKFIVDMEELYKATRDENFNVIIVDYSSTDMDVEQALRNSQLPRSQYIRQKGNFRRSEGLQGGIDLITDTHSIVFLSDLHIHFPLSFIDSVRKHCVEGHMAFAPIVMRLSCGATPQEPHGFWEMNGFGLLGIYKSDLDSVGGMNTKEFTEGWGGEDWELVDRIIQGGLEVKRLYMRNFFHYYHSHRGMWNHRESGLTSQPDEPTGLL